MLAASDHEQFRELGYLRLPAAFPVEAARAMEEMIWGFVSARGVVRDDPRTWIAGSVPGLSPALKRKATFQRAYSDVVTAALDDLLDGEWRLPRHCGTVLVTFPNSAEWSVPHRIWHSDVGFAAEAAPLFGVKTFSFVNEVGPGQGGTCIISGAQHFVERWRTEDPAGVLPGADIDRFMRHSHRWFAELARPGDASSRERFLSPCVIDGHEVRVVELIGQPGDVVITHPWALHCIAANAGAQPRMMLSANINRRPSAT